MNQDIYIGIAEDHELVRQGLVALLKEEDSVKVLFDVSDGLQLLERLKSAKPDIILLDVEMPHMSGQELFGKIKQNHPNIKIIIISAFFHESAILEYIRKGANSFLPKNSSIEKVVEAINTVYEQGAYYDNKVSMILAKEVAGFGTHHLTQENELSDKEISIIRLICQNKSSKEIADQLNLSKKTIDWHRAKIMRKTHSKNITALIRYAVNNGLASLS